jgi:hypothetical protein
VWSSDVRTPVAAIPTRQRDAVVASPAAGRWRRAPRHLPGQDWRDVIVEHPTDAGGVGDGRFQSAGLDSVRWRADGDAPCNERFIFHARNWPLASRRASRPHGRWIPATLPSHRSHPNTRIKTTHASLAIAR